MGFKLGNPFVKMTKFSRFLQILTKFSEFLQIFDRTQIWAKFVQNWGIWSQFVQDWGIWSKLGNLVKICKKLGNLVKSQRDLKKVNPTTLHLRNLELLKISNPQIFKSRKPPNHIISRSNFQENF